jgi:4-oxalocrotonate tautomerase
MPVITLDITRQSNELKAELIRELTETAARVTGIAEEKFIVYVHEFEAESIGVGGKLLSDILK